LNFPAQSHELFKIKTNDVKIEENKMKTLKWNKTTFLASSWLPRRHLQSEATSGTALGMAFGTASRHGLWHCLKHGLEHGVSAQEGDGGPHIHHEQGDGDGLEHGRLDQRR
jgi:hypothetical protein